MTRTQLMGSRALPLLLAASTATCFTLTPQTAHAVVDPVSIGAYVAAAYQVVKFGKEIFGGSGDDLATQLRAVQAAIIGELRSQRNLALKSDASAVFNLFRNLADNDADDPVNSALWSDIIVLQQTTADAMADIINTTGDSTSASELTGAYSTLIATGADVLRLKGDIDPAHPSSWRDFFAWTQAGINTQYTMIKSQYHQCYPGYNPGYRPRPNTTKPVNPWYATVTPGKYRDSLLWKGYENRWIHVQTQTSQCHGSTMSGRIRCNPATKSCIGYLTGCVGGGITWNACSGLTALACAEQLAKPDFDGRAQVKVLRASMAALQTLSGGNDFDWRRNNTMMAEGKFTDPYVDEAACTTAGPWAYAQMP